MESKFLTPLDGRWLEDDIHYVLLANLSYQSSLSDCIIIVPKGFMTDFASVPRLPIVYSLFGDRAHHESVVHDYLYFTGTYSKATSDKIFLEAMKARGKSYFIRYGMYLGVKFGGFKAWNQHRKN